jgi:ATP-dependent exoDNAse (exonuclease V) alpha subunit
MNGLKKYKYFVIDEIGMISNELWKYLMLLKKSNPRAIFILLGDWRQLPPIDEGRTAPSDIFNHPVVKFLCNNNKIELTEKQRYDQQLWDFLEKGCEEGVWEGLAEAEVSCDDIYTSKSICFLNKTRVDINKRCMDYFKTQTEYLFLDYEPKKIERKIGEVITMIDDPKDRRQPVYLYNGLPVMCWKNTTELGIVNSEEFMVSWCDEEKIVLSRDEGGEDVEIATEDFHEYFLANYASTAHKSQGATYKGKVILWDFDRMTDNNKLCYTACSRATAMSNLVIATGIKK